MKRSAHSTTLSGVILLAVAAIVVAPVRPAPPQTPAPTVRFVAAVRPMQLAPQPPFETAQTNSSALLPGPSVSATGLPDLLIGWLERIVVPPSASAPFPEPDFAPVVGGTSIDSVIKNVYNAVEPWVEWGFDVAAYAVGWIPYVGWLAPQIEIFYNFGERIVRSITFNVADWLGGSISFWDGLANVAVDTINSFIYLANDQLAFWLPPLPPIPPIGPFAAEDADAGLMMASSFDESTLPIENEGIEGGLVDENLGEQVEGLGEELTQEDGEQIQGTNLEETDVDLTVERVDDETDLEVGDEATTTDTSGTVQAQGEIRESAVAAPAVGSPQQQSVDNSPADDPTGTPQAPSPQAPSSPDDDPASTDDPSDGGAGTD